MAKRITKIIVVSQRINIIKSGVIVNQFGAGPELVGVSFVLILLFHCQMSRVITVITRRPRPAARSVGTTNTNKAIRPFLCYRRSARNMHGYVWRAVARATLSLHFVGGRRPLVVPPRRRSMVGRCRYAAGYGTQPCGIIRECSRIN